MMPFLKISQSIHGQGTETVVDGASECSGDVGIVEIGGVQARLVLDRWISLKLQPKMCDQMTMVCVAKLGYSEHLAFHYR